MHEYTGPFGKHIANHIALKQALGFRYETEASHLKRFDEFTQTFYPQSTKLTREMVLAWCERKKLETQASQNGRASILRQFSTHLKNCGVSAYVLPKGYYPKEPRYTPHIFTQDELSRFFYQTDQCRYSPEAPYRHLIMPVFFRMIYQCGLRPGEARQLLVSDVDLVTGVLTIDHSKNDKDRLVPMDKSLTNRCRTYAQQVHVLGHQHQFFFPALDGKPMTCGNIYHNFRRFLWKARISHGGPGKGPRIYDFRHCFAVHRLKQWSEEEKNLSALFPLLCTYMGHDSFQDTAYYLRLTADVYPQITFKLESLYPDVIPKLEGEGHEAN